LAERAKQASGQPNHADRAAARKLFDLREKFLSNEISSNVRVKWREEPDWNSWSSIAEFFDAYYAAIVELQNRMAIPLARLRLKGI
jgi:hypothetical protein